MSTTNTNRQLLLSQIDEVLRRWRDARLPTAPSAGWTRTIREALGMTAAAFARRLHVSHGGVRKLEKSEADGTITLASLRRMAEALDCELHYALVPRKPLEEVVLDRARQVASAELASVAHSMALEGQATGESKRDRQIDTAARNLIAHGSLRNLW